jgi:hypothetical protein
VNDVGPRLSQQSPQSEERRHFKRSFPPQNIHFNAGRAQLIHPGGGTAEDADAGAKAVARQSLRDQRKLTGGAAVVQARDNEEDGLHEEGVTGRCLAIRQYTVNDGIRR